MMASSPNVDWRITPPNTNWVARRYLLVRRRSTASCGAIRSRCSGVSNPDCVQSSTSRPTRIARSSSR